MSVRVTLPGLLIRGADHAGFCPRRLHPPSPSPEVPDLLPDQPASMYAIEYVRRGLVPVGRDQWNRIVRDDIPHVRVGNRRVVAKAAVSAWLLGTQQTPDRKAEGSPLRLIESEERARE